MVLRSMYVSGVCIRSLRSMYISGVLHSPIAGLTVERNPLSQVLRDQVLMPLRLQLASTLIPRPQGSSSAFSGNP